MTSYETWENIRDNYINGNIKDTKASILRLTKKKLLEVIAIGIDEDSEMRTDTAKRIIQMVNR